MSFEVEGKCLCFHGPLLYEAKVLRIYDETTKSITSKEYSDVGLDDERVALETPPEALREQTCYFVHYQGWKASWDEWVGLDRVKPYTPENIELKKTLVKEAKEAADQLKKGKKKPVSTKSAKKVGKKALEQAKEKEKDRDGDARQAGGDRQNGHKKPVLNKRAHPKIAIKVPIALRAVLVDDWEYVTKDRKLIHIPSKHPIDDILQEFHSQRSERLESLVEQSQLSEFLAGLRLYFNTSLGKLLLYRLERIQFSEVLEKHKNKPLTSVYGIIHLLRLVTLLPEMMESSNVDDQTAKILVKQCDALLDWIATYYDQFHKDEYVNTSSQYEGVALSM